MKLIYNTIENMFRDIYLIGDDNRIEELHDYYAHNPRVRVHNITQFEGFSDVYCVKEKMNPGCICIFSHEYTAKSVQNLEGGMCPALFTKDEKTLTYAITDGVSDIRDYIVPRLRENGVKVIAVTPPDRKLEDDCWWSIRKWKLIRRISNKGFSLLRHKKRGTAYLIKSQRMLTNDTSRGYSLMYGNNTHYNFDDGFRRTIGAPEDAKKKLYVFGPCFVRGLSSDDAHTIPSLLQTHFAETEVVNCGSEFHTCNIIMRLFQYNPGDSVLIFLPSEYDEDMKTTYDKVIDLTGVYRDTDHLCRHVFDDLNHYDMFLQKRIVNEICKEINPLVTERPVDGTEKKGSVYFGSKTKRAADLFLFDVNDESIRTWIDMIRGKLEGYHNSMWKRGAIIMNCNPFTLGHLYLIESAAKQTDELLVFILQEDRSYFTFEERLEMLKAGVGHLKNVKVFPGGTYVISNQTLPGYFRKNELQDTKVDMSVDLDLFVRIAATLEISCRFAGEEPLDSFTRRYNEKMRDYLPRYGIQFIEIDRKRVEDEVISASRVRKCADEYDWEGVRKLVPESTYRFIRDKYKRR